MNPKRDSRKLPRGRHKLARDEVEANQRKRLLAAATEVLARRGYTALTVDQVIEGAGVSRATFYEQFADKHACVLAAHRAAFAHLDETITRVCDAALPWAERVATAVGAALAWAAKRPNEARLVVETYPAASDPLLAEYGQATHERLAALLRPAPGETGEDGPAHPETIERAVIGATISVVGARLLDGEEDRLAGLQSDLVQLILTPYLGPAEARRMALAAPPSGELEECRAS